MNWGMGVTGGEGRPEKQEEVAGWKLGQSRPGASTAEGRGGGNLEKAGSGLRGERAFPKEGFLCVKELPNYNT